MTELVTDRGGDKVNYRAPRAQLSLSDFHLEKRLGEGSFAQVVQVQQKETCRRYALKVVDKYLVLKHKQTDYISNERRLLDQFDYEGIVRLHFTFQDATSLYFGLELCSNGELYDQIQRKGRLSLEDARFYAAEIVLILEYLRQQQVIHRDLKPENLLINAKGHLQLVDFGSAKDLASKQPATGSSSGLLHKSARTASMVGTAEYLAPEVLRDEPAGYAADLWALGCLLYHMLVGKPPFKGASEYLTFQLISGGEYAIPSDMPEAAQDLIRQLLMSDPSKRLGSGDQALKELKEHRFFDGIDWEHIRTQEAPSVAPPSDEGQDPGDGFDWEWSSMAAALPLYYTTDTCPPGAQTGPCSTLTGGAEATMGAEPCRKASPATSSSPAKKPLDRKQPASASQSSAPAEEWPLAVKLPNSMSHSEGHSSPRHGQPSLPASPSKAHPHAKSAAPSSPGRHHGASSRPTSPHGSKAASHTRKGDWTHSGVQGSGATASSVGQNGNLGDFEVGAAMLMYEAIASDIGSPPGHHHGGGLLHNATDSDT
ncbi:probable 3-phosphoinositide-dependent protein kinase 1 at N-terminal half [Coccomyxa sp. Obi]|nr:probable 3-phosphoinositide-dependent protein kinase 1 at N-terminal half [Coccomyxa sp. Obi]